MGAAVLDVNLTGAEMSIGCSVRSVRAAEVAHVIALDERVTGPAKPHYWHEVFERCGKRRNGERHFLVAEPDVLRNGAPRWRATTPASHVVPQRARDGAPYIQLERDIE